jgi:hypothetical protein
MSAACFFFFFGPRLPAIIAIIRDHRGWRLISSSEILSSRSERVKGYVACVVLKASKNSSQYSGFAFRLTVLEAKSVFLLSHTGDPKKISEAKVLVATPPTTATRESTAATKARMTTCGHATRCEWHWLQVPDKYVHTCKEHVEQLAWVHFCSAKSAATAFQFIKVCSHVVPAAS